MSRAQHQETEARMLTVIILCCYSTVLAAMFTVGYSLMMLALSAASQEIGALYSTYGI